MAAPWAVRPLQREIGSGFSNLVRIPDPHIRKGAVRVERGFSRALPLPRIVPTPAHLDAMVGIWELDGEMISLLKEPETGVLLALTTRGLRMNPIRVISHGRKLEEKSLG